jgi:hypothetical protein
MWWQLPEDCCNIIRDFYIYGLRHRVMLTELRYVIAFTLGQPWLILEERGPEPPSL